MIALLKTSFEKKTENMTGEVACNIRKINGYLSCCEISVEIKLANHEDTVLYLEFRNSIKCSLLNKPSFYLVHILPW